MILLADNLFPLVYIRNSHLTTQSDQGWRLEPCLDLLLRHLLISHSHVGS
jgi:hypothetical protein